MPQKLSTQKSAKKRRFQFERLFKPVKLGRLFNTGFAKRMSESRRRFSDSELYFKYKGSTKVFGVPWLGWIVLLAGLAVYLFIKHKKR